jgi:hypothetical protein
MKYFEALGSPFRIVADYPSIALPIFLAWIVDVLVIVLTLFTQGRIYDSVETNTTKIIFAIILFLINAVATIVLFSWHIAMLRSYVQNKQMTLGKASEFIFHEAWILIRFQLWALLFLLIVFPFAVLVALAYTLSVMYPGWLVSLVVLAAFALLVVFFLYIGMVVQSMAYLILGALKPLHMFREGWSQWKKRTGLTMFMVLLFLVMYIISLIPSIFFRLNGMLPGDTTSAYAQLALAHPVVYIMTLAFEALILRIGIVYLLMFTTYSTQVRR